MRILYIDLDSMRPDHLGCYGYHRDTSPNIDRIAAQGVRFNNCYATDVPCLPSRTALFDGRPGILNGVVNHGGVAATPFNEGVGRTFSDRLVHHSWPARLLKQGYRTAAISPFGNRHGAWWWYAGFNEIIDTGRHAQESADEVSPEVLNWLDRRGSEENWFLHVNFWDAHTPYRTPESFGRPFKDQPLPAWYSEAVRSDHWSRPGPHSARESRGWGQFPDRNPHPDQPLSIDNMDKARQMFDGYDTGVRFADHHLGLVLDKLKELGIDDDTAIIISGDHGENLGELNIYGDHQTADHFTGNVPLIVRWPGVTDSQAGRLDESLVHPGDFAATMLDLVGGSAPDDWYGQSFAAQFREGQAVNQRAYVVVSQAAWTCQRGVRFNHEGAAWMMVRTYHCGYHAFPDVMLFNLTDDPHEQHDLADARQDVVNLALRMLDEWHTDMMRCSATGHDPMGTVLREGGAYHVRGRLPAYLDRLRRTDRAPWADLLEAKYAHETVL